MDDLNDIVNFIKTTLDDKKAEDIQVVDVTPKTSLTKYMIFASGKSVKNVSSLADFLSLELKTKKGISVKIEGLRSSNWVLLDMGDIIVHIFHKDFRGDYGVESLWSIDAV
jgi:ribosome-associated protein